MAGGPTAATRRARGTREDGWRPNSRYELGQAHLRGVHDLSYTSTLGAGVEVYTAGWDSPGFLTADQFAAGDLRRVSNPTHGGVKNRGDEGGRPGGIGGGSLPSRG